MIPLDTAVLCEGCNRISASTGHTCVGCGSAAIVNVARLLAREPRESMFAVLERAVDEVLAKA